MVNWNPYLESLCNTYAKWWEAYTVTDVIGHQSVEVASALLLDFMVRTIQPTKEESSQTIQPPREESSQKQEKTEILGVLEGLRKYASEHVLLVGRPG